MMMVDVKHSMRQEEVWVSPYSFTPTPEGGVEVRIQPAPAAVPLTQTVPCLCGNKLTGKVNIKVWKEPLPLVVPSVTQPCLV